MSKKCCMCDSEKVVFEYNEKYFCSEECLEEYIRENEDYEHTEVVVGSLVCDYCGEEITSCDECGLYFSSDDDVVCFGGFHFCSVDCLVEYCKSNAENLVEKVKKEL